MKKLLIVLLSFIGVVLLAAVLVPIIFKDDIRAAIDKELDKNLNAQVFYNQDAFELTLFKSFPNLTVTVGDFGIAGNTPFEQDTLVSVGSFGLTLDILSVISGDQIRIVNIDLDQPNVYVKVLKDGTANYDIAKATEEEGVVPEEEGAPLDIQIQGWQITDGRLVYEDQTLPMVLIMVGIDHNGSGDFAQDVFDMVTATSVKTFNVSYDGVEYITNKQLTADLTMGMDLANMKFTFLENRAALNNFAFGFDGFVSMPADDIEMDITFGGQEIDLKSVLSLIPGAYQEYLDGVNASGTVQFDGFVRGVYNDRLMPAVAANFGISQGSIAYADYPIPMQDIEVTASFDYPTADLRETSFVMEKFHMSLDGEEVDASLVFKDFEDYYWDFNVNGGVDLEKLTQVIPMEGMTLRGVITAALSTQGRMSDLEAERYTNLPTSGSMEIKGFSYESNDLPQGFGIASTQLAFNPNEIVLSEFKGNAGQTDLNMTGRITNYLNYVLADSAKLYGNLDFYSAQVDANEWMTTDTTAVEETDTSTMDVVRIPEDVDFVLVSRIDLIKYDNLDLKDFNGKVIVRDGAIQLERAGFNLLDGQFELTGAYESALALDKPLYNFDFTIKDMSIASAFQSFNTIQKLVPVAEKMTGKFSTDFKLGGTIGADMMPIYEDMQGAGLVQIASASLRDVKVLTAISNVSKLKQGDGEVTLKDVSLKTEIKGGRLYVEPFDVTLAGRKATVGGSTGVDGSLDYVMAVEVPSGQVGDALNSALASVSGINNAIGKDILLNLGITGNYDDPQVKLVSAQPSGSGGASGVKDALAAQAKEKLDAEKAKVQETINEKKEELTEMKDSVAAEVKEKTEEVKDSVESEAKDKAKDAVKDLFKKKKGGGK